MMMNHPHSPIRREEEQIKEMILLKTTRILLVERDFATFTTTEIAVDLEMNVIIFMKKHLLVKWDKTAEEKSVSLSILPPKGNMIHHLFYPTTTETCR